MDALEQEMGAPGFWDDQERAARTTAEHARATRKLSTYQALAHDVEDLEPLAELAEEDPDIAAELEEQVRTVQERLEALEEERLFAGRYDGGNAFVTVNAGAGGTDAQDWAEMVLRMEMRWAEKRGFEVELLEVSPGEEAGIKSATFLVKGENAYGLYNSEKGDAQDVNFGSQIRSYVLHPYTMVKDHRTDFEMGDANRVLDGDLDGFVRAYLLQAAR